MSTLSGLHLDTPTGRRPGPYKVCPAMPTSRALSPTVRLDTWLTYVIKAAAAHQSSSSEAWLDKNLPFILPPGDGSRAPLVACRTVSNRRGRDQLVLEFDRGWLREYGDPRLQKWFKLAVHDEIALFARMEGAIADETGPLGEPLPRIGGDEGVTACIRCKERPKAADSRWCADCRAARAASR